MFSRRYSINILTLLVLYLVVMPTRSQDSFAFPEREEQDPGKRNRDHRKPLYIPQRCGENELLYPGDQADDWICDCAPGHLFHPAMDKCYFAYKQGPCQAGQYLILPKDKVIPECVENPCRHDGKVRFSNRCYEFGRSEPCAQPELSFVVGIDSMTLEVACIRQNIGLGTRFDDEVDGTTQSPAIIVPDDAPLCAKGCRRYINGKCPVSKKPIEVAATPTPTTIALPELFGIFTTGKPESRLLNKLRA